MSDDDCMPRDEILAVKDAIKKAVRKAVLMERERCAKVISACHMDHPTIGDLQALIRKEPSRGAIDSASISIRKDDPMQIFYSADEVAKMLLRGLSGDVWDALVELGK